MKAIIYESNTGSAKKYALLLSYKLNIAAYTMLEASKHLKKNDEIIFVSWLCAGKIQKYKKAAALYSIKAVCAVGMANADNKYQAKISEANSLKNVRMFYMRGGFDISKLGGIYKITMSVMRKIVVFMLAKKKNKTQEEMNTLQTFQNGGDYVSETNLEEIVNWYHSKQA